MPPTNLFGSGTSSLLPSGDFMPTGTQNQYMPLMPSIPQSAPGMTVPPGVVPQQSAPFALQPTFSGQHDPNRLSGPFTTSIGHGINAISPIDPNFTAALTSFLQSQIGQGVTPFDLSAVLPSSGATTTPGSLSAPLTNLLSMLQQFYQTGQGGPTGTQTMAEMAKTGMPTDVGPAWQAMVDSMQRQIGQGQANLREQFSFGGNLAGSPFGAATTDYQAQTTKDLNSILAQMQANASEAAAGRQLSAGSTLMQGGYGLGTQLQQLDQQSIQALLNEFIRTSPQSNPLLNMEYGLATTFPPTNVQPAGISPLGSLLMGLPGAAGAGITAGTSSGALAGLAAALAGLCWVAEAIYGPSDPRVNMVRYFLLDWEKTSSTGKAFVKLYRKHGKDLASLMATDGNLRKVLKPMFDDFVNKSIGKV